jgi:hypothetical protein
VDDAATALIVALKGACDELARAGVPRSTVEGRLSGYVARIWNEAELMLKTLPKQKPYSTHHH